MANHPNIESLKEDRLYASVAYNISMNKIASAEQADADVGNGIPYVLVVNMEEARECLEKASAALEAAEAEAEVVVVVV